jgi:pilus assembly protein CpaE
MAKLRHRAIRTLVADQSAEVREALKRFFEGQSEFEVVGTAASGEEAVQQAAELLPGLIVMDHVLPRMDGLEATRRIKAGKVPPVVIIFALDDTKHCRRAAKAAGADAVVGKVPQAASTLRAAIRRAFPGVNLR